MTYKRRVETGAYAMRLRMRAKHSAEMKLKSSQHEFVLQLLIPKGTRSSVRKIHTYRGFYRGSGFSLKTLRTENVIKFPLFSVFRHIFDFKRVDSTSVLVA